MVFFFNRSVFWAIVALGSATIFPCFSSKNNGESIPSKKVLKPSVLTKLFSIQHKIYPACVKLLETVDATAFEMYYSIADKYKPPLNDIVFIDGKEFHNVLILSMLKGAAEFDWKKAYSIFYRNKDFEDYKETNAGTTLDEIIQKLDRMRKIDWKSYYKSFGKNNNVSLSSQLSDALCNMYSID